MAGQGMWVQKGVGMGTMGRRARGFTLIELLIVIVIIAILAALLLPAIMKALCNAKSGTASALISNLAQAAKSYELDFAVFPPGKGKDSKDLAYYLQKKGAKQLPYFEFNPEQLDQGNIINPVFGQDGEPPSNWIYYRNNRPSGSGTGPGSGSGNTANQQAPAGQCPILHPSSFDIWCAGCDFTPGSAPAAQWSVKYE